jgi:hypothetical protein
MTHAASVASAGDTVIVASGTYTEVAAVTFSRSGSAGNPITFKAQTIGGAIFKRSGTSAFAISANYLTFSGFVFNGNNSIPDSSDPGGLRDNRAFRLNACSYIIIEDCEVYNFGHAVKPTTGGAAVNHITLRRLNIHNNWESGVCLRGGEQYVLIEDCSVDTIATTGAWDSSHDGFVGETGLTGLTIRRCTATKCQDYGIDFKSNDMYVEGCFAYDNSPEGGFKMWGDGVKIVNCVSWKNADVGIKFADESTGNLVINCTVVNNGSFSILNRNSDLKVINSIIVGSPTISDLPYTDDHNLHYNDGSITTLGANSVNANPQFVGISTGNFKLIWGSPAINSGTSTGAPLTDYDGYSRSDGQIDMGAYEYGSGPVIPPPITGSAAEIRIQVYPNPINFGVSDTIKLGNLIAGSEITIYSIEGKLLRNIAVPGITYVWDGKDNDGNKLGRGVYYIVNKGDTVRKGKLAVASN